MIARADLIPMERVERRILLIRGHRVILDADLADLYGVSTKRLNEQVRRNADRFPPDFRFRLNRTAVGKLDWSQIATGSQKHRDPRYRPFAFTEHGAIMAANVLNSPRAVSASVVVVRAFVRLRRWLSTHRELAQKQAELEERIGRHDGAIQGIMKAIRDLMESPADPPRERIGFRPSRRR